MPPGASLVAMLQTKSAGTLPIEGSPAQKCGSNLGCPFYTLCANKLVRLDGIRSSPS